MVGESVSIEMPGSTGSWREHIVPCKVILDNCTKMFEDGKSDDEVAFQIERHLLIARITKEERHQLDFGDVKLKTDMPPDWKFGKDDPYARLTAAGITLKSIQSASN